MMKTLALLACLASASCMSAQSTDSGPYIRLMQQSWARSRQHGGTHKPVVSPGWGDILKGDVPIEPLHSLGFKVVGGTTHDPAVLHKVVQLGIDGMITDRPDILRDTLREEALNAKTPADQARIANFEVQAHRGGRGFRPENTLPSFENGLDMLVTTLELDTGVTKDHVSLIWHDEYINPIACRRADGNEYTTKDKVYIWDLTQTEAQQDFICDKLYFETSQRNDLALSPVSVAFAAQEHLRSPYSPATLDQLFRFVKFYGVYYRSGPGKSNPNAKERAAQAARVRFNVETKLIPNELPPAGQPDGKLERTNNHTADPQDFVTAILSAVKVNHMEPQVEIQSFDFRTLKLMEEQYPLLPTYYLTENRRTFPYQVTHAD